MSEESELVLQWWMGAERNVPHSVAGWRDAADTYYPPLAHERDLEGRVLSLPI